MDSFLAVENFSALAHNHRLSVVRILTKKGPQGLSAGDISRELGIAPSTLSAHLSQLEHAGLLTSRRQHRNVFYAIDRTGLSRLASFLNDLDGPVAKVFGKSSHFESPTKAVG
ncbi:MAG: metalloregulator ArsR/SmtB family transcription factor [Alphaproteobacteria bacterium]|nr:metalloregulator ArsR/SmtB family transcription factor [Alphaproteobacteria bacterium]